MSMNSIRQSYYPIFSLEKSLIRPPTEKVNHRAQLFLNYPSLKCQSNREEYFPTADCFIFVSRPLCITAIFIPPPPPHHASIVAREVAETSLISVVNINTLSPIEHHLILPSKCFFLFAAHRKFAQTSKLPPAYSRSNDEDKRCEYTILSTRARIAAGNKRQKRKRS